MQKTIGIPYALLYHKYYPLWISFFEMLGFKVITSKETTKKTIENGSHYTVDEACLSLKIFMGHVKELQGKCDCILVPRIVSLKKKEKLCTNFTALYDLCKVLFPKEQFVFYNIDLDHHQNEVKAFIMLGKSLGCSSKESLHAYTVAKQRYKEYRIKNYKEQIRKLSSNKLKILLAGHPYNLRDNMIGIPIANFLEKLGVEVIWSDIYDKSRMTSQYKQISSTVYWTYSKEMLGAIINYQNKVDGVIILSTFPCGTDSLTNEMCLRKITDTPLTVIVIDEQNSSTGLYTRLESFVDIIERRKMYEYTSN